jgi:hypothetical protein
MGEGMVDAPVRRWGIMCAASGVLMVLVGMVGLVKDDDVASTQWSYPQGTGLFLACSVVLALAHGLSAAGYWGVRRVDAVSSRAGRWGLTAAITGSFGLSLSELLSGLVRAQPNDSTAATLVSTIFGITSLVFALGAVVAGVSLLRAGVGELGWLVLLPGAVIVVAVTPANISGSPAIRLVALTVWSLLFIPLGLRVAGLPRRVPESAR